MTAQPDEPSIPSTRRSPDLHLKTAAKSSLGSNEENYSVRAAEAEALIRISEQLERIADALSCLAPSPRKTGAGAS